MPIPCGVSSVLNTSDQTSEFFIYIFLSSLELEWVEKPVGWVVFAFCFCFHVALTFLNSRWHFLSLVSPMRAGSMPVMLT